MIDGNSRGEVQNVRGDSSVIYFALPYLGVSMTINRRWIAREWLYLLAGFVWAYVLAPILTGLLTLLASLIRGSGHFFVGRIPIIAFGPYVIFQLVRIRRWAIRTVREPE